METIQIRKKVYADISFNYHGYEKIVQKIFPHYISSVVKFITKGAGQYYEKLLEFETESDDNIIQRNIAKQENVLAQFGPLDTNSIQTDFIVLGELHNWPRYLDVTILGFSNKDYAFSAQLLKTPKELILAQRLAYEYSRSIMPKDDSLPAMDHIYHDDYQPIQVKPPFDVALLAEVADIVRQLYGITLATTDYYVLIKQLESLKLTDMIFYCTHNMKKEIKSAAMKLVTSEKASSAYKIAEYQRLLILSEFNIIKKIINDELDNSQKFLDIIKKHKILTATDFYSKIAKKDADHIQKIIGDRNKLIFAKPCIHYNSLGLFLKLAKSTSPNIIELRAKTEKELLALLQYDKESRQYYCTKCDQRVLCDHNLEMAGIGYKEKLPIVEQYRQPEEASQTYSYCKYCSEKIYKNEIEEIMTTIKFDAIVNSRKEAMQGDTQTSSFDNGLYNGISYVIGTLKFNYEFPFQNLIKYIRNVIYNMVLNQVTKLKLENDLEYYEQMSTLYGYIYTVIYMMKLFLIDPKVRLPDGTANVLGERTPAVYARFFETKIRQRFPTLTSSEKTSLIMKQAFVDLKTINTITITGRSKDDKLLDILQHPLYLVLYDMLLYSQPKLDTVEAFKYIVTQAKPVLHNFFVNCRVPTKNVDQFKKDLYTYIMDYKNPGCYIFDTTIRPPGAEKNVQFDPTIRNKLLLRNEQLYKTYHLHHYGMLVKLNHDIELKRCYGANYIYDDEGSIMIWSSELDWTTKSGKVIKLSDIKTHVDASTQKKLDTRNARIKFIKMKDNIGKLPVSKLVESKGELEYNFDQKIIGIISTIDNKYSPNILQYLGRSAGHDYTELIRGIVPNVENHRSGALKIQYYCQLFIEKYYYLRNDPMSELNNGIIEESGLDISKIDAEIAKLVDLGEALYFDNSTKYVSMLTPEKYYDWQVESFAKFLVLAKNSIMGKIFLINFLKFVVQTEKRFSKPNPKKIIGIYSEDNLDESEYDESTDAKHKSNDDSADYEQDEDDINDDD